MEEAAAEEPRERLCSQWELTNAICPERSACVNPRRVPAGPHPTRRPLHPPPIPQLCQLPLDGRISHGGAPRARLRAHAGSAPAGCAAVAQHRLLRLLRLFVSWFLDYELIVCSCRLCCFSFALYPPGVGTPSCIAVGTCHKPFQEGGKKQQRTVASRKTVFQPCS